MAADRYPFIALPGGFGTPDEIFATATLIQRRKIEKFPLVFIGREFWCPLRGFLADDLVKAGTSDSADLACITAPDSPGEAVGAVPEVGMGRVLRGGGGGGG